MGLNAKRTPGRAHRNDRRQRGPVALVLAALSAAALACTLSSANEPDATRAAVQATPPVFATATLAPTLFIPSATPLFTATPLPTLPPTPLPCTRQTGWPVYIVQPGDTLGALATRTGTTVDVLTWANCLADPNQIFVGQSLYVIALPATPQPTVTPAPLPTDSVRPVFAGALSVDRHWAGASGQWVTYAPTVRVNAGDVANALRVRFFVNDHANGGVTLPIGQDDAPWDGAFVDYTFPHAGRYTFQAIAENEVASTPSTVFTIQYDPAFVPPEGQYNLLSITPNLGFDGTTYTLPAGSTVWIGWAHAPVGALRVELALTATTAPPGSVGQVIGTDFVAADGVQVSWLVPAGTIGRIEALAYMPDGSQITSRPATVRANQ